MKDFRDRVAVVTGAASGIGRALAEKSAQAGMKVVLADFEENTLKQAEEELKASGADVLAVHTDVSQASDVEALAEQAFATYGAVHLLFNNAGVGAGTTVQRAWPRMAGIPLLGRDRLLRRRRCGGRGAIATRVGVCGGNGRASV